MIYSHEHPSYLSMGDLETTPFLLARTVTAMKLTSQREFRCADSAELRQYMATGEPWVSVLYNVFIFPDNNPARLVFC